MMLDSYSQIITALVLKDKKSISEIDFSNVDFEKLLVKASNNRVLMVFINNLLEINPDLEADKIKKLNDIKEEAEKNFLALKKTLGFLNKVFKEENLDFLVVKTFKYLAYITFDVDFLVRFEDFEKAQKILKKHGVEIKKHPGKNTQELHQKNCFKKGLLKMDMHRTFFWQGIKHIDLDYVWGKTEYREIAGVFCPVPRLEVDFILHNKQLVYERRYVTLLDFLAIKYAKDEGINLEDIQKQVIKYKWERSFRTLTTYLNDMSLAIFHKKMLDIYNNNKTRNKKINLPYHFSLSYSLSIFLEIFIKHKKNIAKEILYYFFTTFRYLLTGRLPFYDHWYDFSQISKKRYAKQECIN